MSCRLSVVIRSHGVEAEKIIQITTAQPSLVLFFEAISGFGEVMNADGVFAAFSVGDAIALNFPAAFNSTVRCDYQQGCVYQYSLGSHTTPFFAPFGVLDERAIDMTIPSAIIAGMEPVIGVMGSALPTLLLGIEGCYDSYTIDSTNTMGWRMNEDGVSLGGWAVEAGQSTIRMALAGKETMTRNFAINVHSASGECV